MIFRIEHLVKHYDGKPLLNDISLDLANGETICLLGASGSGKSTLLRIIAGIETPDAGHLFWQGQDLVDIPANQRNFGLMFQNYALFPHLNVWENVAFGLRVRSIPKEQMKARVEQSLELVNMHSFALRKVTDLSGGEQQRVALARTLAIEPRMLLLDEPLAALDRSLSQEVLTDLRMILHQTGIPAIYVTHDQDEAMAVADRLVMLIDGTIHQQGSPHEIYTHPRDLAVAKFLGMNNMLPGTVKSCSPHLIISTALGDFSVVSKSTHPFDIGSPVHLVLRSAQENDSTSNLIEGLITDMVFSENGYHTYIDTSSGRFVFRLDTAKRIGERIKLLVPPEAILVYR